MDAPTYHTDPDTGRTVYSREFQQYALEVEERVGLDVACEQLGLSRPKLHNLVSHGRYKRRQAAEAAAKLAQSLVHSSLDLTQRVAPRAPSKDERDERLQ